MPKQKFVFEPSRVVGNDPLFAQVSVHCGSLVAAGLY